MTNRMDCLVARETNGKTFWTKIGVAFEARDGGGWNVQLDALPIGVNGQAKFVMRPPRDRDGMDQRPRQDAPRGDAASDDEIPW